MATVNKNFKVKNGLVVEGSTATVAGNQVLTEGASDSYIIDLIGGETLITSVESTQMEVINGELNVKSGVFDESGAAASAQTAAQDFATAADTSLYTTVTSDISTAKSQAISTAAADATSKANAAEASANSYTDDEISALDLSLKAYADQAESDAVSTASADATSKANAAQSAAQTFATNADSTLHTTVTSEIATAKSEAISAASDDATSKANTAQANAEDYADSLINDASTTTTNNWSAYKINAEISAAQSAAEQHADDAVANLVGLAPSTLDTLEELSTALQNNPDVISTLQNTASGKQDTLTTGNGITIDNNLIYIPTYIGSGISATPGNVEIDRDAVDTWYDASGAASSAQTSAQTFATNADTALHTTVTGEIATAKSEAIAAASSDATDKANAAETAANSFTTSQITQEVSDRNSAISSAITTEIADRNTAINAAVTQEVADRNSAITTAVDALTTSAIEEGSNLYFTNQRAIDAVGGTIGDQINLLDTDDIEEGSNLYFTNQRALDATAAAYDMYGAAASAQEAAEDYADGLAINYDAAGSANTAYSDAVAAAALDATTKANNAQTAAETFASGLSVNYDAAGSATAAYNNAVTYANGLASNYDPAGSAAAAQAAAEQFATDAVADLVGSAPALLDTLQELAAALDNDPETINSLQSIAAGKQDALTAGSNIDITGSTISVTGLDAADISDFNEAAVLATAASYDAAGSASTAQAAAESTAQAALDDVLDGTTAFTEINVNSEAKQIAATSSSLGSVVVTAYSWPKADYRSAKLMVKIDNGTDNEVSEVLLTLDSTDNIAITEYAIVGTNGTRGSITARISGANVEVRVDPVNDSTIKITGTLLK